MAKTTIKNDFDINSHDGSTAGLKLGDTLVTATAAELNILDGVTSTAAELNIMDGVTATSTEINLACDASIRLIDVDATTYTVTSGEASRVHVLNHTAAESVVTLPAAIGSGRYYTMVVGAVNTNNHKIQVDSASDVMYGQAIMLQDGGDTMVAFETAADSDTITLNGTTTGGSAIGNKIEFLDLASGKWQVTCHLTGSGTEATPFSAAVS